jgi:hypothetical protein
MDAPPRLERSGAGRLLDDLLPEDLEWESLVRTYPITALLVAGVAGYLLGWRSGAPILEAVGETATRRVTDLVRHSFGEDE